jgi:UDP-N-acetylglucosamine acyltransferase
MADLIHPTALVDASARIGSDVKIGAFSIVGPDVTLEAEVELGHHVVLEGAVVVGARTRIGHASIVGGAPQHLRFTDRTQSGVRIGAGTVIREHVTVHRAITDGGWTEVGGDCYLMATCHVGHDCHLADGVIVTSFVGLSGHCEIDHHATIGGMAGLHQFVRVGEHAFVGGLAKVVADVPPYVIVDGMPATARGINVIGLRRAGMLPGDRRALQDAYRILYRSGLGPGRAVERIRAELGESIPVRRLVEFVAASRRGICKSAADVESSVGAGSALVDDERTE